MPEVSATEAHPPARPHGGSKGVALTNWLVAKATGVLERKTSRRGFLIGSAMAGSAVAVAGCVPAVQPGSAYTHITDCSGGLCTDGYTEFCCTINSGINACPPNSFWGGWWRADYSSFCNGTRYYIDCMQNCCGPATGYQNFCAGCEECRCAVGCDTRHIYCNYFRYGQCHTEIVASGPIACRVVTCVPPYAIDPACGTATLVDNATAEHTSPCITSPPPLVSSGAAAVAPGGSVMVFARALNGYISTTTFNGSSWSTPVPIGPVVNSGIASAADSSTVYLVGRGGDWQLWWNQYSGASWQGERPLSGLAVSSDPVLCTGPDGVHVFVRGNDRAIWHCALSPGSVTPWESLGGVAASNPSAAASADGVFVFVQGTDGVVYANRRVGSTWAGGGGAGGHIKGSPSAAGTTAGIDVFVRGADDGLWVRSFRDGAWTTSNWVHLGGYLIGDPCAVANGAGSDCITWGDEETPRYTRWNGSTWTSASSLGGFANAVPIGVGSSSGQFIFVRGTDFKMYAGRFLGGAWSGFGGIPGLLVASVTALA
jgi:hypothetical protein